MRYLWNVIGQPALFAGLLVFAILGTYRGTAVQDDYTWLIGAVALVGAMLVQVRLSSLRDRLEALEKRVRARDEGDREIG